MTDTALLALGYSATSALYLGYWVSLRLRVARLERRIGKVL
jgi:hypothetical protein